MRTTEGALPTDYTFTGQKLDASAGLLYYGARYYDAAIGRFAQPDSIVPHPYDPQSLNRYTYADNNPVRYLDPTGHDGWDLRNAVNEFAFGLASDILMNQLWFAPQATQALAAQPNEPVLRTVGRAVGDVVSIGISGLEAGAGGGYIGGGIAACGTGVLCLAGAPALVGGVALEAQAATSAIKAAGNLGTNISMAAKKAAGDSEITNKRPEQSRTEMEKSIRSLRKRIDEHQQKIENREGFDPVSDDPVINERAVEARIEHLQHEIDNWEKQIEGLQKMLDALTE